MGKEYQNRTRLVTRMIKHGARRLEGQDFFRQAHLVWQIEADREISEDCVHMEEFMASAARNCKNTVRVISRVHGSGDLKDPDLLTALKKYVEDTCGAVKEVDNTLKRHKSSLTSLLFEVPDTAETEVSWRNLIARRDVIAHALLTINDEQVYAEAKRDFASLYPILSNVYFSPVKTDLKAGEGVCPLLFRADAVRDLIPSVHGQTPRIGEALIFICEDKNDGLFSFRLGRTETNGVLVSASRDIHLSLYAMKDIGR